MKNKKVSLLIAALAIIGSIFMPFANAYATLDKTGEERYSGAGIKMKIVAYKSAKSIEVEFEDGSRRNGISYGQFTLGDILHPKLSNNWEVGNYIVTGLAYIASDGHGEFYCRNKETDETDILSLKEIMGR